MTLGVWTGHCSGPGLDCHTGDVTPGEELQHSRGQDARHQLVKLRCQGSAINNFNCYRSEPYLGGADSDKQPHISETESCEDEG